jgi:hypothetical protein
MLLVGALLSPTFVSTTPAKTRPTSKARLEVLSPAPGSTVGEKVPVKLRLTGAKLAALNAIVPSKLPSDRGHIHLLVDGKQLLMIPSLDYTLEVPPGPHTLRAEFAAVDHAPFNPPVVVSVDFTAT